MSILSKSIPRNLNLLDFTGHGGGSIDIKTEESSRFQRPMADYEFQQVFERLKKRLQRLDWQRAQAYAKQIENDISWLDSTMTRYCADTCPTCEDPCCQAGKIFYNQADLLYLAAADRYAPPGQTRSQPNAPCRYLVTNGCMLLRTQRPYVCVWFLCESQMEMFQDESALFQRHFLQVMTRIRYHRVALESLYQSGAAG